MIGMAKIAQNDNKQIRMKFEFKSNNQKFFFKSSSQSNLLIKNEIVIKLNSRRWFPWSLHDAFNELNSRAAFNFGPMWIKCSLFFFCFLSSRIIGLFLLHSCLSVLWPQNSLILPLTYGKFSTIVVVSPTLAPLISCKPFLSISTQALHYVTDLTECQVFAELNWRPA